MSRNLEIEDSAPELGHIGVNRLDLLIKRQNSNLCVAASSHSICLISLLILSFSLPFIYTVHMMLP